MIYITDQNGKREVTSEEFALMFSGWSKENHIAEINEYHNQQFDNLWQTAGYLGAWEVAIASNNPELEYHLEAQSIMNYLWEGEQIINTYAQTVVEETAQTPEELLTI